MKLKLPDLKKELKRTLAAAMALSITAASLVTAKVETQAATMRDAWTITKDMKAGFNLGNSLESEIDETYWGNPKTTRAMIDKIRERGFTTLRIPTRWDDHYTDSNYTIDPNYFIRVKEVVDYGINNGMYVILNVHHNDIQTKVSTDSQVQEQVKNEYRIIWTQIANYFKGYDDKLIFETINEPRKDEDWMGCEALYDCTNEYNKAALEAIRATGGNNSERLVLLPTYCASSDEPKLAGWKNLTGDQHIAVSIHAYVPFSFAYEGKKTVWTDELHNELKSIFARYYNYFLSKGIPVVLGEFGSTNSGDQYLQARVQYTAAYAALGNSYGIPCAIWDNNLYEIGLDNYGMFDRNTCTFRYGEIADALINAYNGSGNDDDNDGDAYKSLFWSENGKSGSNWEQAVTVKTAKNGGTFMGSDITPGGYFYVEYSGTENELEFILQSYSPQKWSKVERSETGSANGHYFAKYSYDKCVDAFGTSDFNSILDQIHVGATSQTVTVYSVCYCYPK